jgi:phenylpropionate dioxygenase-like ring-hydroxylating dioxygenase large terminal subunit
MSSTHETKLNDSDLCHVGPGTPAGEMFRRYWLSISRSEDLKDVPLAVKVLGEELVLFRDGQGRLGLVGLHCSHRGSSLEYGDIEEKGIRCIYHGWLYDVDGNCLDQPLEPAGSTF